jgi:Uma2 family endonuclease
MPLAVSDILRSPRAKLLLDQLRTTLDDEAERRMRFRDEKDEKEKSECLNGRIFVHSPVKWEHNRTGLRTFKQIDAIVAVRKLGEVGLEKCMIGLTRNDVEPDICFWRTEVASLFDRKQMVFPAPDLVVEVLSPSTETNDRGLKFDDYAAHGIREYWIVDPDAETVEQYLLRPGADEYTLHAKTRQGPIISPTLGDDAVPARALFDDAENLVAVKAAMA